ncbi:hypothetical protein [Kitasatospora purpeofusca]|uniref:hypothetical protein n=1 Tax=Kitasatospora purpeofusca TaxID=67352 RepID=UPI0036C86831
MLPDEPPRPVHVPAAVLLGRLVLESTRPRLPGGRGKAVPTGWWVSYVCTDCLEPQHDALPDLPVRADRDALTAGATAFFGEPCVLRSCPDGFAVYPADRARW